ncbi:S9 family peptidase [Belliella kenyensis]|uniref:S9 family peptidase n=1 Tax=Belliella kenyensis TaxID=1472724 RepID=A0ABV8EI58_9BACT|nr:S9 family peptidase [Belliella kenyensis]MCH7401847.1 S9 family peptidase [Belliella kenyensis]MDN3604347.1 S9 family peptidase [Belliella kenyensis]
MSDAEWEFFHSNELQVDQHTPPAFLVHSWDDKVVPVENSIRYAKALNAYDIPVTPTFLKKVDTDTAEETLSNTALLPNGLI